MMMFVHCCCVLQVRWGNIGCAQFATSMLPVRSLCRMKKFVVPLVPGK